MEEQTPVSNPLNQLPNDSIKSNSLIKLMSILLLISCVIAGFFAYQTQKLTKELLESRNQNLEKQTPTPEPTTDPTSDWKTYTNEKYGFSFKYPSRAKLEITNFTNTEFNLMLSDLTDFKYEELVIFVGKNWAYSNKNSNVINYKIAGIDAFREDLPSGQNPPSTGIYFKNDGYTYTIQQTKDLDDKEIEKVFDQILSTFKFLDKTVSEETEINNFAINFAQTFIDVDWVKLQTLLTSSAAKEMQDGITNFPQNGYSFDGYEIKSVQKSIKPQGYKVNIRFFRDGKAVYQFPNSQTDPTILIVKENNQWKSMTWYLYQ